MQMRQEQQKYQYMLSPTGVLLRNYQYQPMGPNQRMYANPQQFHPQMMPTSTDGPSSMPGQPQMSQADMQMGLTHAGTISQSMPQIPHSYAMSTTNAMMNQPPVNVQASMNHAVHSSLGQQMSMPPQMFMQHQMRMPVQPGVHQIMPQNLPNGPGPNVLSQNGQQSQTFPKQSFANQQQVPNPVTSQMPAGQHLGQTSNTNPLLGMQMPNMGMQLMQNNQGPPGQIPISGYSMSLHNASQMPNMQPQMSLQSQGMNMPGQPIMTSQPLQEHVQGPQNMPSQGSQMPSHNQQQLHQSQVGPGQPVQGQMHAGQPQMQGQMVSHPQSILQNGQQMQSHQMMNQQIPMQGQTQMPPMRVASQQMQQIQNQLPQQPPISSNQPQFQQVPHQAPQMQETQGIPQQNKMSQPNVTPPAQQAVQNQQKPSPPPVKSESNNNTAELISFD